MRLLLATMVLFAGCASPIGQRVRALLIDDTLTCTETTDGARVANLELELEDDLFLVEVVESATGDHLTLPSRRQGRFVTISCPEGLETLTVRRISILDARAPAEPISPGPPP